MSNVFKALEDQGIAPVISLNDAAKAQPLAKAFIDGGITNIEITLRTDEAIRSIRFIKDA